MITLTGSHSTGIGFVFENLVTIPGGEMGGMYAYHEFCLFIHHLLYLYHKSFT